MTNSRSPCLTNWPSLKLTVSMNPETRARTSTCSTATNRPVYSSHSVIVFCSGCATVTGGGGGAEAAPGRLSPQLASAWAVSTNAPQVITRVMGLLSTSRIGSARELSSEGLRSLPFDAEHWHG